MSNWRAALLMAQKLPMTPPTRPTAKTGYLKLLAPPSVACPHCDAMNTQERGPIYWVVDERGKHGECDACAHHWPA